MSPTTARVVNDAVIADDVGAEETDEVGQIEEIMEDMSNYVKIDDFFKLLQDDGVSMTEKEIKQHEANKKKKKRSHIHQGNHYYGKIYSLLQLVYQVYR